jgi:hypothetical protein
MAIGYQLSALSRRKRVGGGILYRPGVSPSTVLLLLKADR